MSSPFLVQSLRNLPSWLLNTIALLAGGLIPLSFAPFHLWPLGIVALTILALLIDQQTLKVVLWRCWIFAVGMYGVGVSWVYVSISGFGGAPIPLALLLVSAFVCFLAAVFSISFYAYGRWFSRHHLSLLVAFPITWLFSEWLRTWLFTGFPWLFVGYAHLHTWLAGWAPVIGVLGLSLICAISAGLFAEFFSNIVKFSNTTKLSNTISLSSTQDSTAEKPSIIKNFRAFIIVSVIALVLWGVGAKLRGIEWTQATASPTSVAIVQPNVAQDEKWQEEYRQTTLDLLQQQTANLWHNKIIIWPEAAVPFIYSDALPFLNDVNRKAADNHAGLITGIIYDTTYANSQKEVYYNSVVAFGDAIGIYNKRRLVPFGEYVPFEVLRNFIEFFNLPTSFIDVAPEDQHGLKIDDILIAPSICYEVAYPDLVAKSAIGSQLLMSVSNLGWFGDSLGRHQFMEMAQMRALETQHYFAYSTNNGPSALFDRKGNIIAQTKAFEQTTLSGQIFATNGATPFMRWGSWPIILISLAGLIGLAAPLLINKNKKLLIEGAEEN